jgi:hypothetical protein
MEHQINCSGEHGDYQGPGSLVLTGECLSFTGAFSMSVPLADIDMLRVHRGVLHVTWPSGTAAFALGGRHAQDWADLIRGPRPLMDKLGVQQGARVLVSGITDFGFRRQLQERAAAVLDRAAASREQGVDLVFLGVEVPGDLGTLSATAPLMAPRGALWIVRPTSGDLREADVQRAGRDAGLTLVKAVAFSDTHTAHKFVVTPGRR